MYRYYQKNDGDTWRTGEDKTPSDPWSFAAAKQATRVTVLCVSEDLDLTDKRSEVAYSGPLFFDIDDQDLGRALKSASQLCAKFKVLGVDPNDVEIHLSGKKGVHIYVHPLVFSDGEPVQYLPEVYAKMAMHLWVEGMDFQVYSEGKGRMVRPPNGKRPDERYKVVVTQEEFAVITPEAYTELVLKPRTVEIARPHKKCEKLAKIFDACKASITKVDKKARAIPVESIAKLGDNAPHCVQMLAEGKRRKVKGDAQTSFNNMAMQVGCWSRHTTMEPAVLESLHNRIAQNNPSASGEKPNARARKLHAMHLYLKKQPLYNFSCGAIKKLVEGTPDCAACPVYKAAETTQPLQDSLYLFEHGGQYYSDKDRKTLIAPFSLKRECMVMCEDTRRVLSTTFAIYVPMMGVTYSLSGITEDAFTSKLKLKSALQGFDGVGFFGTDNDVSKLRMTLANDDWLNGGEINQVYAANKIGLHYTKRRGPDDPRNPEHVGMFTYIETDSSVNDVGIPKTHLLTHKPKGAPKLLSQELREPVSDIANEALSLFLRINKPELVATLFGWMVAAHLKVHIFKLEHRFPLLCISGVAGTGKNSTLGVAMRLAGVTGESAMMTLEAPNATKLPFQVALSDTTTIPRIINEMNPKSVHHQHYKMIVELLKGAFDGQSIEKGRLGGGNIDGINASVVTWKISSPLVVLSEEPINVPAVLHRAIMLDMTPSGLDIGRDAFESLEPRADDLVDVGRALVWSALNTPLKEIDALLKAAALPEDVAKSSIPDRLKFGYKVILIAFDWAVAHLLERGVSEENMDRIKELRQVFFNSLSDDVLRISAESSVTEVDKLVKHICIMAYSSNIAESRPQWALTRGVHYAVQGESLFIDTLVVYPLLSQYLKTINESLAITTEAAFLKTARAMPYYVSDRAQTALLPTMGRNVLELDLEELRLKNLPVEMLGIPVKAPGVF